MCKEKSCWICGKALRTAYAVVDGDLICLHCYNLSTKEEKEGKDGR